MSEVYWVFLAWQLLKARTWSTFMSFSSTSHLGIWKCIDNGCILDSAQRKACSVQHCVTEHPVRRLQDLDCNFSIKDFRKSFDRWYITTASLHASRTKNECIWPTWPSTFDIQEHSKSFMRTVFLLYFIPTTTASTLLVLMIGQFIGTTWLQE